VIDFVCAIEFTLAPPTTPTLAVIDEPDILLSVKTIRAMSSCSPPSYGGGVSVAESGAVFLHVDSPP
jgi:hypothetical protein